MYSISISFLYRLNFLLTFSFTKYLAYLSILEYLHVSISLTSPLSSIWIFFFLWLLIKHVSKIFTCQVSSHRIFGFYYWGFANLCRWHRTLGFHFLLLKNLRFLIVLNITQYVLIMFTLIIVPRYILPYPLKYCLLLPFNPSGPTCDAQNVLGCVLSHWNKVK